MAANPTAEFICPRCNQTLKERRTAHGIFWACDQCGGRAVTVELLRRTFTPESINPLWLHAIRREGKSSCLCPSCRKPMFEVPMSDSAKVDVDVCQHCHFVWFDGREVDALVPLPPRRPEPKLPQKARESIALEEIKQITGEASPDEWWKQIADFFGLR